MEPWVLVHRTNAVLTPRELSVSSRGKPLRLWLLWGPSCALRGRCAPRIVNNKSIAHLSFGLEGNKFFGGRDPLFQSKWTDQSPASPGASSLASWVVVVVVVLGRREVERGECGKCTPSPFSSLISSPVSYLLYLLISFPLPAPSKSPFVCFSSFLAPPNPPRPPPLRVFRPVLLWLYNSAHVTFWCSTVIQKKREEEDEEEEKWKEEWICCFALMAFCVKVWSRVFLPQCCWCWTGLAGGLYLVPLRPWTNLRRPNAQAG